MENKLETKRVLIKDATAEQLYEFSATVLGLEIDPKERGNKEHLAAAMDRAGYKFNNIAIITAPQNMSAPSGEPEDVLQKSQICVWDGTDDLNLKRARLLVYIIIPDQDRPGGDQPVPAGCNGTHLHIERNTPSLVPEEYIESLSHAVETRFDPSSNDEESLSSPRYVQRYPFQRVAIPSLDVLVNPHGKPYELATAEDVKKYKKSREEKELAKARAERDRMRKQGLVA